MSGVFANGERKIARTSRCVPCGLSYSPTPCHLQWIHNRSWDHILRLYKWFNLVFTLRHIPAERQQTQPFPATKSITAGQTENTPGWWSPLFNSPLLRLLLLVSLECDGKGSCSCRGLEKKSKITDNYWLGIVQVSSCAALPPRSAIRCPTRIRLKCSSLCASWNSSREERFVTLLQGIWIWTIYQSLGNYLEVGVT